MHLLLSWITRNGSPITKLPYTINTEMRMLYNPQLKGAYNFVPGVMAMVLMLVCTMMTAITIVQRKRNGHHGSNAGITHEAANDCNCKSSSLFVLSAINISSILLLSVFVLDVPINGSLVLLADRKYFVYTCFLIVWLTDFVRCRFTANSHVHFIDGMFLPTVMLSGFMFPVENMPLPLRIVSNVVPAKWYYKIVKSVMIKGIGLQTIWKETLILTGMMIFFLSLRLKILKSDWHENTEIFIAKRIQADIS